jgi:succinoglycan biosynthesis transport protein ExoP
MSFVYFIKLLLKNLLWLILIPFLMAGTIFYFTRTEVKVYSSESVIYTGIASGYSLSGSNKADYFATSNAFDNLLSLINSRDTKQDVAIHLLANHLLIKKFDVAFMSAATFRDLKILVPDSIRQIVVKPTLEETIVALHQYMSSKEGNLIFSVINSDNPFYSVNALDNIKANRINTSDLIKISYQCNDAVICKQTLELLEESFMRKHRMLKEGQSESVVDYFEKETRAAFARLNGAEETFMQFNKQNDIINYYEQTKAVAIEKENLEVQNHNLVMDRMASSKSLETVNENIKGRLYQSEYGAAILKDKEQLSDVKSKIAVGEIMGKAELGHQQQQDSLQHISILLERKLQVSVNNLYLQTLTPNGIPTKTVLDEWLKSSLAFEQSKARLTAMDKRRVEFVEQYRKYAPLGATLKKIERQINVSEQEYLELLHGLNTAKLTQQNNELITKLNVVDPPFLPLKANPSKRMMLVIVGFLTGFILVVIFVMAHALINKTVQRPDKACQIVGIPLLGIYPLLNANASFVAQANLRLMQQLLSRMDALIKPVTIGLISVQNSEGKSTILDLWEKELTNLNYKVITQQWKEGIIPYTTGSDIVLIEFPPLDTMVIKPGMLPKLDHSFLLCRANRIWGKIDKQLLAIFTNTTGNHPSLLLNGTSTDFAEEYIGEVPRKRSVLRAFIKKVFKFEFGDRKKFIHKKKRSGKN